MCTGKEGGFELSQLERMSPRQSCPKGFVPRGVRKGHPRGRSLLPPEDWDVDSLHMTDGIDEGEDEEGEEKEKEEEDKKAIKHQP